MQRWQLYFESGLGTCTAASRMLRSGVAVTAAAMEGKVAVAAGAGQHRRVRLGSSKTVERTSAGHD